MLALKRLFLFILILSLIVVTGCNPPVLNDETADSYDNFIVARADSNFNFSARDLYYKLNNSTILSRGGYLDEATVKHVLDSLVVDSLTGFEADKIDLRNYFYDNWNYKLRYYDYLIQVYLYEKVYSKVTIDSLEVVEFYKNRPDLYTVDEQLDLYHIFLSKPGLKESKDSAYYNSLSDMEMDKALEEYTFSIYKMLTYGEPFQNLAYMYSHDELSRRASGAVGWTSRGIYLEPFDSVAFSLHPGEFSEPYKDKDGWHIIYMNDYLPQGVVPYERYGVFESARESLMTEKSNRQGRTVLDSLAKEINVLPNEAILNDTDIYMVDDSTWCGIVNGLDTIDAKEVKNYEHSYRKRYAIKNTDGEMKKELLNEIAQRYIIIQAVRNEGFDTLSRVIEERERLRHLTAKSVIEKSKYDVSWKPTEEAVKKYYDEHQDQYVVPKPLKAKYLTVQDSVFAEFIRDQVLSGMAFEDIAKADYAKKSKIKITDLGYVSPSDVDSAFYSVIRGTPLASVSGIYKDSNGYHLVKVSDIKQSFNYNQARGGIITLLTQQYRQNKLQAFQERIFTEYHVEFPKVLKTLHLKPYQHRIR